jgi:hypothetical protein
VVQVGSLAEIAGRQDADARRFETDAVVRGAGRASAVVPRYFTTAVPSVVALPTAAVSKVGGEPADAASGRDQEHIRAGLENLPEHDGGTVYASNGVLQFIRTCGESADVARAGVRRR